LIKRLSFSGRRTEKRTEPSLRPTKKRSGQPKNALKNLTRAETRVEIEAAVARFLASGKKIQIIAPGETRLEQHLFTKD
jgi:hypothetical protein